MAPIRVLLVEDSPVVLIVLKRIFASSPEIEVVGTARNGLEALAVIPKVRPDVICTDFHMAQMNGLEFIKEVMAKFPRPILVISASVQAEDTYNVFQLLEAGAVDVFPKPTSGLTSDYEGLKLELTGKIKILSGVKVFTRHQRGGGEGE
ncbi:response regulator, partial [Kamptonema sp. UHCC 0994]|uniref:response regulator n=1 Tax=Kamptonema sp. UHCC 0994 TaxID=3031329 RepID=UPI0023BA0A63